MTTRPWPSAYSVPSRMASRWLGRKPVRPGALGRPASAGASVRRAGTRVVRSHFQGSAVAVAVSGVGLVLLRVGRLRDAGRRGRAGDVGDGRDVVPVDAVADPQEQPGQQHAETDRRWGGGGCGQGDGFEHGGGSSVGVRA